MLAAALLVNVVVLIPVVTSLATRAGWVELAYGARTPARNILLAIYLAILAASAGLLPALVADRDVDPAIGSLLVVQVAYKVAYKVASAVTVRSLRNPVVASNLLIAAFHASAVALTWA